MPEYSRPPIDRTRLCLFYALAYSLTWAFTIPFVYVWLNITHHRLERWMIVFLPGAYGPSFAAIIVTAMTDGRAGVRRLLGKLLLWRFPAVWWTFVAAAPLTVVIGAIVLSGYAAQAVENLDLSRAWHVVPLALLIAIPFGPLPEELGWRGYALPELLRRHGTVASSLIVGFFWTFWHTPMFWFPGAAIPSCLELSVISVAIFLVQMCAESVTLTIVSLHTRGSVVAAIALHLFINAGSNIAFGLTAEPPAELARHIYYGVVLLHCLLAAGLLAWHTLGARAAGGQSVATIHLDPCESL